MKKNSKSLTRSDFVDLVQQIHASLKPEFTKIDRRFKEADKRLSSLEISNKQIVHHLGRVENRPSHIEKQNGSIKTRLKRAGKIMTDV